MKSIVYLAGQGTNVEASERWRKHAIEEFNGFGWVVLNPFSDADIVYEGQYTYTKDKNGYKIVYEDLDKIAAADVVLVEYVEDVTYLGTFMEIFYAWTLGIPVVMWTTKDNVLKHPWLSVTVAHVEGDLDDAINYIINTYE